MMCKHDWVGDDNCAYCQIDELKVESRDWRDLYENGLEDRNNLLERIKQFEADLEKIIEVASGAEQVADDDTGGMEWIDKFARKARFAAQRESAKGVAQ